MVSGLRSNWIEQSTRVPAGDQWALPDASGCRPVSVDRCPGSMARKNREKPIMYSIYLTIYLSIAQEIKEG